MGSSEDFGHMRELGYATACLDADEQRAQTDARVKDLPEPLSGQESLGTIICVAREAWAWKKRTAHPQWEKKTDKGGASNTPHWLFVESNEDDIHNHNNGNSQ